MIRTLFQVSQESQENTHKGDCLCLKCLKGNFQYQFLLSCVQRGVTEQRAQDQYCPNSELPRGCQRLTSEAVLISEAESDVPGNLASGLCRLLIKAEYLPSANRKSLLINDSMYQSIYCSFRNRLITSGLSIPNLPLRALGYA